MEETECTFHLFCYFNRTIQFFFTFRKSYSLLSILKLNTYTLAAESRSVVASGARSRMGLLTKKGPRERQNSSTS